MASPVGFRVFILSAFAVASMAGASFGVDIENGQMTSCPLMGEHGSFCQMSVTEHIANWQQTFFGIPSSNALLVAMLLLAFSLAPFGNLPSLLEKPFALGVRLLSRHAHELKLFDPLQLALSDGILNPKLYDSRIS